MKFLYENELHNVIWTNLNLPLCSHTLNRITDFDIICTKFDTRYILYNVFINSCGFFYCVKRFGGTD